MTKPSSKDEYSKAEAAARFVAALRGARITGHKPMKSMTPKGRKAQRKKAKQNDT
jgi:hypothetical protein